ncbi:MAG: aspartate kinase [Planctomycetota bacterium]
MLKFGGTSLADAAAIRRSAAIVVGQRNPVVVLSAAAGVTDRLVTLARRAPEGEDAQIVEELLSRHASLGAELGIDKTAIAGPLEELRDCARGMALLAEDSAHARDRLLACGELLMVPLFAAYLRTLGVEAQPLSAASIGLITDDRHGRARPLAECFDRMATWFSSRGLARHGAPIPVITGFIGGTSDGRITTLGRGGSDYSASLIARALDAAELQIWTDVDGIHTCDPRIVPEATRIEHLTFREAGELAYCGAKVLHPQTLAPAMHHGIPVSVRDTRHPDRVGTSITAELPEGSPRERIRAIAHRSGVRVVTVVSPRMLARHGFLSRIAATFDSHGISIDMISTSEVSVSLTPIDPDVHLGAVIRELESFAEVDVIRGKGMVSVVGDRLDEDGTVVAEVLGAITARGVAIDMISYGATHTNLTFLVPQEQVEDAVRALHSRFFVPA